MNMDDQWLEEQILLRPAIISATQRSTNKAKETFNINEVTKCVYQPLNTFLFLPLLHKFHFHLY